MLTVPLLRQMLTVLLLAACLTDGGKARRSRYQRKYSFVGENRQTYRTNREMKYNDDDTDVEERWVHCSSPSGSVEGRIVVEEEGGTLTDMTVLTWQIGLGETLCYRFSSEKSDLKGVVEVSFRSLRSVYSITDTYQFQLPSAHAQCICDCPGGKSHCSSSTDLCKANENCVNFYTTSSSSTGCFFSFLKLSSAVCCALRVEPVSKKKYRAVNLRVPNILAQFRTRYIDINGTVMDTRTYNVDLNSGTTIDWDVSLQVSSPGPTSLVPSGWYVVPDIPTLSHTLLAGEEVNPLDGWDIDKLGWFKTGIQGTAVAEQLEQLVTKFSPQVDNCAAGDYSASFSSGKINQREVGGRPVQDLFPFIRRVRVWRRHVEMEHRESPLLSLSLQHRSRVGVVVQSSTSHIADFTGYLYQDKFSHLHLNLSLVNATGTLSGIVSGSIASQVFLLRVNTSKPTYGTSVRLSMTSCTGEHVRVSIHPIGRSTESIRKKIPCVSENQRIFRSARRPEQQVEVTQGMKAAESSDWLSWIDPVQLFSGPWTTTRIVTVSGICAGILIMLIIICKCIKSCCSICD